MAFKEILAKPAQCDNTDREDDRCGNLSVFNYRGNDGRRYTLCRTCTGLLIRIAPSLASFL